MSQPTDLSLDLVDLKIIRCLTDDARRTYKSISDKAGVSEAKTV